MKKIIVGLLISFALISCKDKNAYTITGTIDSGESTLKVVLYEDLELEIAIDSTVVKNGSFSFKGTQAEPALALLNIYDENNQPVLGKVMFFILEPGEIKIDMQKSLVSGTHLNDIHGEFHTKMTEAGGDNIGIAETFIKENIGNVLGVTYLTGLYRIFEPEELKELLASIPENLKGMEGIAEIEEQLVQLEATSFIGKSFLDIKGLSIDGKEVKLSDFAGKGKIVLVDFWASWCGPCIQELPNVKAAYAKYKDKGFEIVGVSLDDDKKAWAGATKKHGITWPQFSNLKGWDDEAAAVYNVRGIPFTLLIDKDGTIIKENLRGSKIAESLELLLNK